MVRSSSMVNGLARKALAPASTISRACCSSLYADIATTGVVAVSARAPDVAHEVDPVHPRHPDVEQDQVRPGTAVDRLGGGRTIGKQLRAVAERFERERDHLAHAVLVFGHQHEPWVLGGGHRGGPVRERPAIRNGAQNGRRACARRPPEI